jgi:glycosyltransferase involved in cell wall biosynthesis
MRIGLVTGEYPPMQGGVGAFTAELARALAAAGHEMHIITSLAARPAGAPRQTLLRDRPEPVNLGFAWLHARVWRWRWPALALVADITLRHSLEVVDIQYQAAAYQMSSAAANFLPWRLKGLTRTVVTFHDLRVPYLFPKAGRLRSAAVHFMARQAHGAIATNREDYAALARLGLPAARLRQIPIGSNIESRDSAPATIEAIRRKLSLPAGGCLLGYFGFLNPSKGADLLLRALARLDERFHLLFVGGPTGDSDRATNAAYQSGLEALAAELHLDGRVHWTGFVDPAAVSDYLNAADLVVLPYRDGASLRRGSLMAGLAHGRPIITTEPATPLPEVVHGENAWLAPVDDPVALAEAITLLAAAPERRSRLGAGARLLAQGFAWERIAGRTAAFFSELLTSR